MKTITFAIMAVLIFGVAASPIFSNGFVYAQSDEDTNKDAQIAQKEATAGKKAASEEITSERTSERDTTDKDDKVSQKEATAGKKAASEEIKSERDSDRDTTDKDAKVAQKEATAGKKAASEEIKSDRSTDRESIQTGEKIKRDPAREGENQRAELKEKFANMSEEKQSQLTERLDAMKAQRSSITPHSEHQKAVMEMSEDERLAYVEEIREQRSAEREARENMSDEERQEFMDERIAELNERRENSLTPRDQIALGMEPTDVMCIEGYELVIRTSNNMPVCMAPDTAVILLERGVITYPEE